MAHSTPLAQRDASKQGCDTAFDRGSVGPVATERLLLGERLEIARIDELQLVRRCKEGSESAFAELVRRYRPRLFTLAYRLTADRESAEDVVQETFVAAFRALERFEPRPSLGAWLNTIAIRLAGKSAIRSAQRPRASLDALADNDMAHRVVDATTGNSDPYRAAEAAELRREVEIAIAALPFKYRAAVVTRYVLDLEYAEAAAALEMGLNTYKSHLLRGTRMLRDLLAPVTGRGPGEVPAVSVVPRAARPPIAAAPRAPALTRTVVEPRRGFGERVATVPTEKAVRG
jgi:RNA polymerase sigma-70 factor (ECF subfamily)